MEHMIKEGFLLKQEIDAKKARLSEINAVLAENAEFKKGGKTGHLSCPGINVKIQMKENVKWDQEKLRQVQPHFGDFHEFFEIEYKPDTKAINGVLKNKDSEFAKAIEWCREIKPANPYVTYESVEEEEVA